MHGRVTQLLCLQQRCARKIGQEDDLSVARVQCGWRDVLILHCHSLIPLQWRAELELWSSKGAGSPQNRIRRSENSQQNDGQVDAVCCGRCQCTSGLVRIQVVRLESAVI